MNVDELQGRIAADIDKTLCIGHPEGRCTFKSSQNPLHARLDNYLADFLDQTAFATALRK